MSRILHIVSADCWGSGHADYRGDTLETEGFIHCSTPAQVIEVANRRFRGRTDLLLVHIDPARVKAAIRYENLEGGYQRFPHIYGPLNRDAVVRVEPLTPDRDGRFRATARSTSLRQRTFARLMAAIDGDSHEIYRERKVNLLASLGRRVIELGPGTGVNLQFFDPDTEWIGVEPNAAMHPFIRDKAVGLPLTIEVCPTTLDRSDIADDCADAVVSTLVLCSVPSIERELAQVLRVLKPGGRFVFLEHVADRPGSFRRIVQKSVPCTPWRYFSDGCDPARDIGDAVCGAGFSEVRCESYLQDGPGLILAVTRPHIAGTAIK